MKLRHMVGIASALGALALGVAWQVAPGAFKASKPSASGAALGAERQVKERPDGVLQMPPGWRLPTMGSDVLIWQDNRNEYKDQVHRSFYSYSAWNVEQNKFEGLSLPESFVATRAARVAHAWFFVGSNIQRGWNDLMGQVQYLPDSSGNASKLQTFDLPGQEHGNADLLALSDGSALVLARVENKEKTQHRWVVRHFTISTGRLVATEVAPLPAPRRGVALLALADGRAMAIGGSNDRFIGCDACVADTWLFDAKTGWSAGPPLREPRSDASATLMPDGSVLVMGGWSPGRGWQTAASNSAERWQPGVDRFEVATPLPTAMANHEVRWANGERGRLLLALDGWQRAWETSKTTLAFDTVRNMWITASVECPTGEKPDTFFAPASIKYKGRVYEVCYGRGVPPLARRLSWPDSRADSGAGYRPSRSGAAHAIGQGDVPTFTVGGRYESGATTAVGDALFSDGRVHHLPQLSAPRSGAKLLRLKDQLLIFVGGSDELRPERSEPAKPLPIEWMRWDAAAAASTKVSPNTPRWRAADIARLPARFDALAQDGDSGFVTLDSVGIPSRYGLRVEGDKLVATVTQLPQIPNARAGSDENRVSMRVLSDGRIVVSGGKLQEQSIALVGPHIFDLSASDLTMTFGDFEASRSHDIYDPKSGRWNRSADSPEFEGQTWILSDGRVLKIGKEESEVKTLDIGSQQISVKKTAPIAISNADGNSWAAFPSPANVIRLSDRFDIVEHTGELFVLGENLSSSSDGNSVAWFNAKKQAWQLMWSPAPNSNWRSNLGRIVPVKLPDGRQLWLPLESW